MNLDPTKTLIWSTTFAVCAIMIAAAYLS